MIPTKPEPHYMIRHFDHDHLPLRLHATAGLFWDLARQIDRELPNGPEKTEALHDLLDAMDWYIRGSRD